MNPLNYMRLHDHSSENPRQHWTNASNGKISHGSSYPRCGSNTSAVETASSDPALTDAPVKHRAIPSPHQRHARSGRESPLRSRVNPHQQTSPPAASASISSAPGSPPGADAVAESSWLLPSRSARREPSNYGDDESLQPYHLSCCRLPRCSRRSVSG